MSDKDKSTIFTVPDGLILADEFEVLGIEGITIGVGEQPIVMLTFTGRINQSGDTPATVTIAIHALDISRLAKKMVDAAISALRNVNKTD